MPPEKGYAYFWSSKKEYHEWVRIGIINSFYTRNVASGENNIVEAQSKLLEMNGHQISRFFIETDEMYSNFTYPIKRGLGVAFGFGQNPIKFLEDTEPELTVVHNLFPNIGENWIKKWNGPIIQFLHNFRSFCSNGIFFRNNNICMDCTKKSPLIGLVQKCYRDSYLATTPLVVRQLLRIQNYERSNHKFAVLSHQSKEIFNSLGVPNNKMFVIPNFTSSSTVTFETLDDVITEKDNKWVYSGRLNPGKGIVELASNWPKKYKLDIFGTGSQFKEISEICKDNTNIRMMGFVEHTKYLEMLKYYRGAVLPSNSFESSPVSCIEFLSHGLPVISHENNAMSSYISKYRAGEIFRNFNEIEFDRIISKIDLERNDYKKNSMLLHKKVFSQDAWLKKFYELAQELGVNAKNI